MAVSVIIDIIANAGNVGNVFSGIESAVNLVSRAFDAAVNVVTPFINAATESEDAVANLDATLRSMGDVTGLSSQQLQDMAGALQEVTRYSDESIINAEAMLLTFGNIGGETFPRATEAMLDLASKFGSLDQASVMLGKALNDPIAGVSALRRVGVQLTEEQEKSIKIFMEQGDIASAQAVILGELERQVGGLAEAYGETFAGKLEIFKNRLGEVQEVIGKAIIPILTQWLDKVIEFMPILEDFGGRVAGVFAGIAEAGFGSVEFQDALAHLFGVNTPDEILPMIDQFVANIFNSIADAIDTWASGSGPDELSDRIVAFIENIGTGGEIDSKALQAMQNVLSALVRAVGNMDWSAIGRAIDLAFVEWSQETSISIDTGLASALSGNNETLNAIDKWFADLSIEAGKSIDRWFANLSIDIGQGIMNGLNQLDINAQKWVDDHIINPIKRALGIASPSSVFMQIGRDIVSGLIIGFGAMVGSLVNVVAGIVDTILAIFQPVLDVLGIDIGGSTSTGELGGRSTGTAPGSPTGTGGVLSTAGGVINNFYGNVYFGDMGQLGYDCPSPHPLMAASANSVLNLNVG
jgi:hypothetical protein